MKLPKLSLNQILLTLLLGAIAGLVAAYASQYGLKLKPCMLCIYQRLPFFGIAFLSFVSLIFLAPWLKRLVAVLCLILILTNVGLGAYHVGLERKIFKDSSTCSLDKGVIAHTIEDMKLELLTAKVERCDQPEFFLFGLSLAEWALAYYFLFFLVTLLLWRKAKHR